MSFEDAYYDCKLAYSQLMYDYIIDDKTKTTVHGVDYDLILDHIHLILEALEKQVPKKPKLNRELNTVEKRIWRWTETYTCPTCGNALLKKKANDRQDNRYCWDCGQRLDWE